MHYPMSSLNRWWRGISTVLKTGLDRPVRPGTGSQSGPVKSPKTGQQPENRSKTGVEPEIKKKTVRYPVRFLKPWVYHDSEDVGEPDSQLYHDSEERWKPFSWLDFPANLYNHIPSNHPKNFVIQLIDTSQVMFGNGFFFFFSKTYFW